jgi:AcrR family transcriptional regulator
MTLLPQADRVGADALTTIERIRNAALQIVAGQGVSGTSLRAVAAAAGVSLGLVQHHFATKAGLIEAVDDYVFAVVINQITKPVPDTTSDSVTV